MIDVHSALCTLQTKAARATAHYIRAAVATGLPAEGFRAPLKRETPPEFRGCGGFLNLVGFLGESGFLNSFIL